METILIYEKGKRPIVSDSSLIYDNMKDIKDEDKELVVVFYLDTRNKIIKREIVCIGTLNTSLLHPRELYRNAILINCNAIIISHNHPSGDSTPSKEDMDITRQIKKAGDIIGIPLLDHVIVGNDSYTSLNDKNLM